MSWIDWTMTKEVAENSIAYGKSHRNHAKNLHGVTFYLIFYNIYKRDAQRVAREFRALGYRAQYLPARWEPTGVSMGRWDVWIRGA